MGCTMNILYFDKNALLRVGFSHVATLANYYSHVHGHGPDCFVKLLAAAPASRQKAACCFCIRGGVGGGGGPSMAAAAAVTVRRDTLIHSVDWMHVHSQASQCQPSPLGECTIDILYFDKTLC